jgi:hypothetical protein
MIVAAFACVAVVGCANAERTIEAEGQQRLRGKANTGPSGYCLSDCSGSRACRRANGSAFSSAGDRADYAADDSAAAYVFACSFIDADAFPALVGSGNGLRISAHYIALSIYVHGLEVNDHRIVRAVSQDQFGIRASRDHDASGIIHNIAIDHRRVDSAV